MRKKKSINLVLICIFCLMVTGIPSFFLSTSIVNYNISDQKRPEKSIRFNPITIYTPQPITYTAPMSGYYPGTYGFEDGSDGYVPRNWVDRSTGTDKIAVVSSKSGHNKVLKFYDYFRWFDSKRAQGETSFSTQLYGTIEFWFLTSHAGYPNYFILRYGDTNRIVLKADSNRWWYKSGSTYKEIPGLSATANPGSNFWYHIQIHFETRSYGHYHGLHQYKWKIRVGDDESATMSFTNTGTINKLVFQTNNGYTGYYMYIDAVGFSWDPYYDIYDNKFPGIFLDFSPSGLDYMSCSFDGQYRDLYGDTVFPMPKSGSHSISVYGENWGELPYVSDVQQFSVNIPEQIGVIFYASNGADYPPPPYTEVYAENVEMWLNIYMDVMKSEGYDKFYVYRDIGTQSEFDTLMNALANKRIDYSDELFFVIWTHGTYSGSYSESYAGLSAHPDGYLLPANHYREKMDYIVSQSGITKIGSLVEACYSGWFAYRLNKAPYLAISSGDKNRLTYGMLAGERFFLGNFWDRVDFGNDAYEAFIGARSYTHDLNDLFGQSRQNPQCFDNLPGSFMFFD